MKSSKKSRRLPQKNARTLSTKKSSLPFYLQGMWGFWFGALVMATFIGIPLLIRHYFQ